MKALDAIRAKHDRLAAEELANPRTSWPAGTILMEGEDSPDPTTGTVSGRMRARAEREARERETPMKLTPKPLHLIQQVEVRRSVRAAWSDAA